MLDVGKRAFHDVAVPIGTSIERRRPPTSTPASLSARDLVFLLRNHCPNATRTQVLAIRPGPISTISQNGIRTRTLTTATSPGHSNVGKHLRQNHPVVTLPASDHHSQGPAIAVDGMMDLRRQPTTRATDAMPCRLTLLIGQILVIRRSPLCPGQGASCSLHAGGHD